MDGFDAEAVTKKKKPEDKSGKKGGSAAVLPGGVDEAEDDATPVVLDAAEVQRRNLILLRKRAPIMLLYPLVPVLFCVLNIFFGSIILQVASLDCVADLEGFLRSSVFFCYFLLMILAWVWLGPTQWFPVAFFSFTPLVITYGFFFFVFFIVYCYGASVVAAALPCITTSPGLYSFSTFSVVMYWISFFVTVVFCVLAWRAYRDPEALIQHEMRKAAAQAKKEEERRREQQLSVLKANAEDRIAKMEQERAAESQSERESAASSDNEDAGGEAAEDGAGAEAEAEAEGGGEEYQGYGQTQADWNDPNWEQQPDGTWYNHGTGETYTES